MDRVVVRIAEGMQDREEAQNWARTTPDGDLLDLDIFEHDSTLLLAARPQQKHGAWQGNIAYLPVQRPLMLENLIFQPGLNDRQRAQAITRLAEYAVSEAYRRDAGELYFLCRDESTIQFAERHCFKALPEGLKVFRLNLRETFGN